MAWKMINSKWKIQLGAGYTLIEILVTLTIIGILFSFGYVNFRDFSRRQALVGVVKQIQGDLRLAQQDALSGQKPDDLKCISPNTLSGYNFSVVSSGEYEIRAVCSGGIAGNPEKNVILPSDITITTELNPIFFKILGQGTNISGAEVKLTLTQTGTDNSGTVTVTSGGEIK